MQTSKESCGAEMDPVAVSRALTELIPDTDYYARLCATNAKGTTISDAIQFHTLPAPHLELFYYIRNNVTGETSTGLCGYLDDPLTFQLWSSPDITMGGVESTIGLEKCYPSYNPGYLYQVEASSGAYEDILGVVLAPLGTVVWGAQSPNIVSRTLSWVWDGNGNPVIEITALAIDGVNTTIKLAPTPFAPPYPCNVHTYVESWNPSGCLKAWVQGAPHDYGWQSLPYPFDMTDLVHQWVHQNTWSGRITITACKYTNNVPMGSGYTNQLPIIQLGTTSDYGESWQ